MLRVWTVARQTLTQCLRSRIQLVFIALLAAFLILLPEVMSGDKTLAGRIRSFLSYAQGITALLLGTITILMSVHLVSSDVSRKYVFSLATKPLARWQYVLGRWLGVVLLNGILLLLASVAIYGQAQMMRRGRPADDQDRLAVETEIFTVREQTGPEPVGVEEAVEAEIEKRKEDQPRYEATIESLMLETGADRAQAEQEFRSIIANQISNQMEVADPLRREEGGLAPDALGWRFTGIHPPRSSASAQGTILQVTPGMSGSVPMLQFRVEVEPSVLRRLMENGPVVLDENDAYTSRVTSQWFEALVPTETASGLRSLSAGDSVEVVAESTINLEFKLTRVGGADTPEILADWRFSNPSGTERFMVAPRKFPHQVETRLSIPARIAGEQGDLLVSFRNYSPARIKITTDDISLWYPVTGFLNNFIRGTYLRWVQLMFLAGVGVFFGTFLSFPVGMIASFCLLPFSIMREFLDDAALAAAGEAEGIDLISRLAIYVQNFMFAILPNLQATSTGDYMVDGLVIPLSLVGRATFYDIAIRCVILVGAGCLIWHKRELAKPQEG